MSQNLATEDYIFPKGKTAVTNVSPIIRDLKGRLFELLLQIYTKKSLIIMRVKTMIHQLLPHQINMII
jgi:hypothetical protein